MLNTPLFFVGKLANSPLLAAFPALNREILPHFSFATNLCKTFDEFNLLANNP